MNKYSYIIKNTIQYYTFITIDPGICIMLSMIMGSAVFTRDNLLKESKSPIVALGIWFASYLFCAIGGNCYAELGK